MKKKYIAAALALLLLALGWRSALVWTGLRHVPSTGAELAAMVAFYRPPGETPGTERAEGAARNVILMIGDGMGAAPLFYSSLRAVGKAGRLHMETMPSSGLVKTYPGTSMVTDSAAAGTAMGTGVATANGRVGQTADGEALRGLITELGAKGWTTGVVTDEEVYNPTPGGFSAHAASRHDEAVIARQMLLHGPDIMLGGGRTVFLADGMPDPESCGYRVARDKAGLDALVNSGAEKVLGLFASRALKGDAPEPTLEEMTRAALELAARHGDGRRLFLLVEGGRIDAAGHAHNIDAMVVHTLEFDMAVAEALRFARERGDTLVVVTADHDTGGLILSPSGGGVKEYWGTRGHTATPVPLFAYGPGAEAFSGVMNNYELHGRIAAAVGE